MNKGFRTTQRLVLSALLLSAVTMAQAEAKKTDTASKEHHSKMSKVAFWRHHNDDKNAKQHPAKPAKAKQTQAKQAQVKPAKQSQAGKAQVKPVSAKQAASKTDQKQNSKTASPFTSKAAKAPSAQASKSHQKSMTAQNSPAPQKDSAKQ